MEQKKMTEKQVFSVFLFFYLFKHLRCHIRIPIVVKADDVSAGCTEKKRGKPAGHLLVNLVFHSCSWFFIVCSIFFSLFFHGHAKTA